MEKTDIVVRTDFGKLLQITTTTRSLDAKEMEKIKRDMIEKFGEGTQVVFLVPLPKEQGRES